MDGRRRAALPWSLPTDGSVVQCPDPGRALQRSGRGCGWGGRIVSGWGPMTCARSPCSTASATRSWTSWPPSAKGAVRSGRELFVERRPADYWWVLLEGTVSLVRRLGQEEAVLAAWSRPGSGPVASGLGPVRRLPRHRPGHLRRPHAAGAGDRAAGAGRPMVPVRRPLHQGPGRDRTEHRVGGPAAGGTGSPGHAGGRVRPRDQQPGVGGDPGRRARCRTPAPRCCPRPAGSRPAACPPTSSPRSTRCGGRSTRRRASTAPLSVADREDALSDWLAAHGVERDWFIAPPLAAAGVDAAWCERAAAVVGGGSLEAGLEWVAPR